MKIILYLFGFGDGGSIAPFASFEKVIYIIKKNLKQIKNISFIKSLIIVLQTTHSCGYI
jgi:hypothetical protein